MNFFEIFLKGGVVMWLILASSVLGFSVVIDRFLVLRKAKINVPAFMVRLRGLIKKKDINFEAYTISKSLNNPKINSNTVDILKKYNDRHKQLKKEKMDRKKKEIIKRIFF